VRTYNLDLTLVGDQWGWYGKRFYHHTTAISTLYAMREALALVADEGLDNMWQRHFDMHKMLWEGLKDLKLEPFVQNEAER
jgi:alanine-glyoxylate transaminase/serine-glyoxylate transaminase/serine-pyruvate transaminase